MSPLILASQSQALPLLFLPLAMSAGHPDGHSRHLRASAHAQTGAVTPMLFPVSEGSCSQSNGVLRQSDGRYTVVIDPRLDVK